MNNIRFNLIDKITVLRTFALSKLWFLLNFITIEEDEIVKIEKLSFNYIWNGKAELIARKILYCDFKEGGLNMVCIRAKIKMIFIRNLLYTKLNRNRPQYQFSLLTRTISFTFCSEERFHLLDEIVLPNFY